MLDEDRAAAGVRFEPEPRILADAEHEQVARRVLADEIAQVLVLFERSLARIVVDEGAQIAVE